jgi:alginate O-acetyltransferase complex protein AlgI
MFVFWGFLHGAATVIHTLWSRLNIRLHPVLAWAITFNFVNVAWVFFRAKTWDDALKVISGMLGLNGIVLPDSLLNYLFVLKNYGIIFGKFLVNINSGKESLVMLIVLLPVTLFAKNSMEIANHIKPNMKYSIILCVMAIVSILFLNRTSEFLYFRF